jgi:hypothetical protein
MKGMIMQYLLVNNASVLKQIGDGILVRYSVSAYEGSPTVTNSDYSSGLFLGDYDLVILVRAQDTTEMIKNALIAAFQAITISNDKALALRGQRVDCLLTETAKPKLPNYTLSYGDSNGS